MRTLYFLGLLVPLICYLLDSSLPKFYIFDPVKLQELSKASIEAGAGNTTVVMEHLVAALQEEYGPQHVNGIEKEKWFFK
jgi:C-8 sterol isomerase